MAENYECTSMARKLYKHGHIAQDTWVRGSQKHYISSKDSQKFGDVGD